MPIKIRLGHLPKGFVNSAISPPLMAREIIASAGNRTAVMIKPKPALKAFAPACMPTSGGNIILPAPKKAQGSSRQEPLSLAMKVWCLLSLLTLILYKHHALEGVVIICLVTVPVIHRHYNWNIPSMVIRAKPCNSTRPSSRTTQRNAPLRFPPC